MAKTKYFQSQNLITGLKGIGVSIITMIVWMIPIIIARYLNNALNQPAIALLIALLSLIGYIHTWGYFWRLWKL